MDNKEKKFTELNTAEELENLMRDKAKRHTYYFHYSNLAAIDSILGNKTLWISPLNCSNDKKEHDIFDENTKLYFQLCFSTGTTEILPMWFLYCGRNGIGANLKIKKSGILRLLEKPEISFVEYEPNQKELIINKFPLEYDKDYKLDFVDVIYRRQNGKNYRLKYNGSVHNCFPSKEWELFYKNDNKGFTKDLVWYYEKESRLLIKLKQEALSSRGIILDKNDFPYRLEFKIPEVVFPYISLTLSPKYSMDKIDDIHKIIKEYKNIGNQMISKFMSENQGEIDIDLCKNC